MSNHPLFSLPIRICDREEEIDALMNEADANGDGEIDFSEFVNAVNA